MNAAPNVASVQRTAVRVRVIFLEPYWEQVWNEKYGLLWRIEPLGGDGSVSEARSKTRPKHSKHTKRRLRRTLEGRA